VLRAKVPELVAALAVKATPPVEDDVAANLRAWQAWHQPQPTEDAVTRACGVCQWPVNGQDTSICPCCGFQPIYDVDPERYREKWDGQWFSKAVQPPAIVASAVTRAKLEDLRIAVDAYLMRIGVATPDRFEVDQIILRAHLKGSPDAD
jgi:hypothetical protein